MSERDDSDKRYARWWEPVVAGLIVITALLAIGLELRSEIRDLQRRIAVLEAGK